MPSRPEQKILRHVPLVHQLTYVKGDIHGSRCGRWPTSGWGSDVTCPDCLLDRVTSPNE